MANQKFYRLADLTGTAATRRRGERGMLPFSPASLWRRVHAGEFPAPVKLSAGVTAFPAEAVDRWIEEHATGRAGNAANFPRRTPHRRTPAELESEAA